MRLLLARHGATPNNAQRRYTGQTDVPLSAVGERQVKALGDRLAHEPLDAIVASDLRRAQSTAAAVAAHHPGLSLWTDGDLRELAMGAWEGLTHAEAQERDPARMEQWQRDPLTTAPPGGETVLALRDRALRALERWQAEYADGTVLWVTHGGLVGVLISQVIGMDLHRRWQLRCDPASLSELSLPSDGDVQVVLMRLNDTTHLDEPI